MKLYLTATGERGKPANKGAQEWLEMRLTIGTAKNPQSAGMITLLHDKPFYYLKYEGNEIGAWTENKDGTIQPVFEITKGKTCGHAWHGNYPCPNCTKTTGN